MTRPDADALAPIAEGLGRRAGFRFNLEHPQTLVKAVDHRLSELGLDSRDAYLRVLHGDESEWTALAEEVANHETSFFRHQGQFRALSESVLPELLKSRADERRLRIWSAACSTGEEPYSLGIAVDELNLPQTWKVDIVATDLSQRALRNAERALFSERRLMNVPEELLSRQFEKHGKLFRPREPIRSRVTFEQLNLTTNFPARFTDFDVIFCENVLIYFLPDVTHRVVGRLRDALREGGYLFLGYSETLFGNADIGLQPVRLGDTYVYRRKKKSKHTSGVVPAPSHGPARKLLEPPAPSRPAEPTSPRPPAPVEPLAPVEPPKLESLIAAGELAAACRVAERWQSRNPGSVEVRFLVARLLAATDRAPEAAGLLRRVLLDDPLHAPSYALLASLCLRNGETEEALAQLKKAAYIDAGQPLVHLHLGNIHQQRGQSAEALHAYKNALRMAKGWSAEWDSGFTPELLTRTLQKSIARLEKKRQIRFVRREDAT